MKFVLTFEMTGGLKIRPKADAAYQIEEMLDQYLEAQDYGNGVLKFHVVLKVLNAEQSLAFPAGQFYRPRRKEVLFAKLVEIEQAVYSSVEGWNALVCGIILNMASRFEEIGVKHFDFQRFQQDLQQFFRSNGWIR